jgi:peptide/nickel transport system ATP-binding protein/oligopeptide transport system ATP-binding protein
MAEALLEVEGLVKHYRLRGGQATVRALDGISLRIGPGETLGLVGESGSGKSTAARCIVGLIDPDAGTIRLDGAEIARGSPRALRRARRRMQMVFQDPYASLNPRMRAAEIVAEPLVNYRAAKRNERRDKVASLFEKVGLRADDLRKYPHQFSGGQRQRLGIARALTLDPALVVCDEPVSALDVSIQAQIINLLMDLQEERGLAYLFVAHDLAVVEQVSHRVAVMYLGKIVEQATTERLFAAPQHPYTEALLASVPRIDVDGPPRGRPLAGEIPSAINPPSGCAFHTRCPYAEARCRVESPALREIAPGHHVACHLRG